MLATGLLVPGVCFALVDADERMLAVAVLATATSDIVIAGVGAAFWALVAGLVVRAVFSWRSG